MTHYGVALFWSSSYDIERNKVASMSNAISNQLKIKDIRQRMLKHEITYEQAQDEAKPVIDDINAKSKLLAKKYKLPAHKINFASIMR